MCHHWSQESCVLTKQNDDKNAHDSNFMSQLMQIKFTVARGQIQKHKITQQEKIFLKHFVSSSWSQSELQTQLSHISGSRIWWRFNFDDDKSLNDDATEDNNLVSNYKINDAKIFIFLVKIYRKKILNVSWSRAYIEEYL